MIEYIHYGHTRFDISKFEKIRNINNFVKPHGGLWASPVDAKRSWKIWCEENEFHMANIEHGSFIFTINNTANISHLYSVSDLYKLPKNKMSSIFSNYYIDFEECVRCGIDAIELHLSEEIIDDDFKFMNSLYWKLYGWDCDSILILNPNIIITKE